MPLNVAALDVPHRYGDPIAQLQRVNLMLAAAPGLDLALLPECALTGYVSEARDFDLSRFAEPLDGPTAAALSRLSKKHSVALAGPLIEQSGDARFNSFVVFDAAGALLAHYRKKNPWLPEAWATAGDLPNSVFRVGDTTLTMAICFDVHFLGEDAALQLSEADVLLFPSAWVDDGPGDGRSALLPEVARRFDVDIVNANWGEGTPWVRGQGGSRLVARDGAEHRAPSGFSAMGRVGL